MPGDNKIMLPQRQLFKELYTNPESETFGNAYGSAIEAGFSESYAKQITAPSTDLEWVREIMRDHTRLQKAEKVIDKMLDLETKQPIVTMTGVLKDEHGEIITKENANLLRVQQDTAKFVAKGMAKQKYSERQELTAEQGENLFEPLRDALIALAHDNSTTEDPNDGGEHVQEQRRRSLDSHANTVRHLRSDIQKALSTSQS